MSKPELFIIESLGFDNEKEQLFEGRVISQILHLSDKKSIYYYIRTKAELSEVLDIFKECDYRYLHISSHGSWDAMHTTIDAIPFDELGKMLRPVLDGRRLFLSACSMTNVNLARKLMPKSGCFSIVGPKRTVNFNDAAILWASFYHLMFKSNARAMKHAQLEKNVQNVSSMFKVPLNYYQRSKGKPGYKSKIISP